MARECSAKTILEPVREIPVLHEADVVVCGGGPAGAAAAIAAARSGAKTVVVEYHCCLGGMASSGMMCGFGPLHDQQKMIVGGIPWEIVQRLVALNAAEMPRPCPRSCLEYFSPFDPEALKYVLDLMAEEAGVKVLLCCQVAGIVPGERGPAGVIVESKSGRMAIPAKVIVDATGDGDVAVAAGAPYEKGRGKDGLMQPMSLEYKVHNLDRDKATRFLAKQRSEIVREAREKGEAIPTFIGACTHKNLRDEETFLNPDHAFGVDGTRVEDLSRVAASARKQIWQSVEFCRRHVPGYERAYLCGTASQIGVRETRRITGEYVLTIEDVLGARQFDDAVARYACWVDIHRLEPDPKKDRGPYARKGLPPGASYGIPYRSLVPRGVENVLVAGRCFSATHEALASARMIPCCMAMGQAAGTAGALAAKQNISPRRLDVGRLRSALSEQGVRL